MRFIINPLSENVVAATGEAFTAFNLTPERADALLQAIDAAGGKATTGVLAQVLGCNIPDAARLLGELSDRGSVRALMDKARPVWERRSLDLNSGLVREEHVPRILAFLVGRRELPGAIASALGLPRDEVGETCKFLMVGGQLVGTHIGAATVYALDIRGTTRIDMEAASRVASSPQARFQAELAALPPVKLPPRPVIVQGPERAAPVKKARGAARPVVQKVRTPVKLERVLVKSKASPAAQVLPEGAVQAIEAARSLGIKPGAFYKWIENHEEARVLCVKGRRHLMVPPLVLELYIKSTVPNGATFAAEIPEGWPDIWQTVEAMGWSYHKVYAMLDVGRLRAVQAGSKLRFDPQSIQTLKAELDAEEAVPEGWTNLRLLAAELELHISSVVAWMRRRRYETPKYRDAARQLVVFAPDAAATAYRAARAVLPGGIKLTPEMREAIRRELPPVPPGQRRAAKAVQAVADRYGVTVSRVQQILTSETPSVPLSQAAD